ncbi:hypothetical protein X733_32725 [Mesorhizobium sp. L2C067A000]|nr:hypothetical protein X733_32725 [Mesorhizobium sp. L2C067A000]
MVIGDAPVLPAAASQERHQKSRQLAERGEENILVVVFSCLA